MRAIARGSLQCGHCARRERQSRCRSGACSGPGSVVAAALGPGCPPAALAASLMSHSAQNAGLVKISSTPLCLSIHLLLYLQYAGLAALQGIRFTQHMQCDTYDNGEPCALQASRDNMQDPGAAKCDMRWITITSLSLKAGRQKVHRRVWRLTGPAQAVAL